LTEERSSLPIRNIKRSIVNESATYDADKDKEVQYESRDLYPDPGCDFLDDDEEDDQKNGQKEMK
jgi:hypothetical protein